MWPRTFSSFDASLTLILIITSLFLTSTANAGGKDIVVDIDEMVIRKAIIQKFNSTDLAEHFSALNADTVQAIDAFFLQCYSSSGLYYCGRNDGPYSPHASTTEGEGFHWVSRVTPPRNMLVVRLEINDEYIIDILFVISIEGTALKLEPYNLNPTNNPSDPVGDPIAANAYINLRPYSMADTIVTSYKSLTHETNKTLIKRYATNEDLRKDFRVDNVFDLLDDEILGMLFPDNQSHVLYCADSRWDYYPTEDSSELPYCFPYGGDAGPDNAVARTNTYYTDIKVTHSFDWDEEIVKTNPTWGEDAITACNINYKEKKIKLTTFGAACCPIKLDFSPPVLFSRARPEYSLTIINDHDSDGKDDTLIIGRSIDALPAAGRHFMRVGIQTNPQYAIYNNDNSIETFVSGESYYKYNHIVEKLHGDFGFKMYFGEDNIPPEGEVNIFEPRRPITPLPNTSEGEDVGEFEYSITAGEFSGTDSVWIYISFDLFRNYIYTTLINTMYSQELHRSFSVLMDNTTVAIGNTGLNSLNLSYSYNYSEELISNIENNDLNGWLVEEKPIYIAIWEDDAGWDDIALTLGAILTFSPLSDTLVCDTMAMKYNAGGSAPGNVTVKTLDTCQYLKKYRYMTDVNGILGSLYIDKIDVRPFPRLPLSNEDFYSSNHALVFDLTSTSLLNVSCENPEEITGDNFNQACWSGYQQDFGDPDKDGRAGNADNCPNIFNVNYRMGEQPFPEFLDHCERIREYLARVKQDFDYPNPKYCYPGAGATNEEEHLKSLLADYARRLCGLNEFTYATEEEMCDEFDELGFSTSFYCGSEFPDLTDEEKCDALRFGYLCDIGRDPVIWRDTVPLYMDPYLACLESYVCDDSNQICSMTSCRIQLDYDQHRLHCGDVSLEDWHTFTEYPLEGIEKPYGLKNAQKLRKTLFCPEAVELYQPDEDEDGAGDACDNCPKLGNEDQAPATDAACGDKRGLACDPDMDNDGLMLSRDLCDWVNSSDPQAVRNDCNDDYIHMDVLIDRCPAANTCPRETSQCWPNKLGTGSTAFMEHTAPPPTEDDPGCFKQEFQTLVGGTGTVYACCDGCFCDYDEDCIPDYEDECPQDSADICQCGTEDSDRDGWYGSCEAYMQDPEEYFNNLHSSCDNDPCVQNVSQRNLGGELDYSERIDPNDMHVEYEYNVKRNGDAGEDFIQVLPPPGYFKGLSYAAAEGYSLPSGRVAAPFRAYSGGQTTADKGIADVVVEYCKCEAYDGYDSNACRNCDEEHGLEVTDNDPLWKPLNEMRVDVSSAERGVTVCDGSTNPEKLVEFPHLCNVNFVKENTHDTPDAINDHWPISYSPLWEVSDELLCPGGPSEECSSLIKMRFFVVSQGMENAWDVLPPSARQRMLLNSRKKNVNWPGSHLVSFYNDPGNNQMPNIAYDFAMSRLQDSSMWKYIGGEVDPPYTMPGGVQVGVFDPFTKEFFMGTKPMMVDDTEISLKDYGYAWGTKSDGSTVEVMFGGTTLDGLTPNTVMYTHQRTGLVLFNNNYIPVYTWDTVNINTPSSNPGVFIDDATQSVWVFGGNKGVHQKHNGSYWSSPDMEFISDLSKPNIVRVGPSEFLVIGAINSDAIDNNVYHAKISVDEMQVDVTPAVGENVTPFQQFSRISHGLAYKEDNDTVYLFGGANSANWRQSPDGAYFNDLWGYNVQRREWYPVSTNCSGLPGQPVQDEDYSCPPGTAGAQLIYNEFLNELIVVGGRRSRVGSELETWYLSLDDRVWRMKQRDETHTGCGGVREGMLCSADDKKWWLPTGQEVCTEQEELQCNGEDKDGSWYGFYFSLFKLNRFVMNGDYAYVASNAGLQIVSLSVNYLPLFAGWAPTSGAANDVVEYRKTGDDQYVYVGDQNGIRVFDVDVSLWPDLEKTIDLGEPVRSLKVYQHYLIAASNHSIRVYDIDDPPRPRLIASTILDDPELTDIDVMDSGAGHSIVLYASGQNGIYAYHTDLSMVQPTLSLLSTIPTPKVVAWLRTHLGRIYAVDETATTHAWHVGNPLRPMYLTEHTVPDWTRGVVVDDQEHRAVRLNGNWINVRKVE